jgi:hypothetical protein
MSGHKCHATAAIISVIESASSRTARAYWNIMNSIAQGRRATALRQAQPTREEAPPARQRPPERTRGVTKPKGLT